MLFAHLGTAHAQNAGKILNHEIKEYSVGVVNGIVMGVAYSHYMQDRPNTRRHDCIMNWYSNDSAARYGEILKVFQRYPDKSPSGLIYVLLNKKCGVQ